MFKLPFPQFALVELVFHRPAALEAREGSHPEKDVRIFNRKKRAKYFHPNLLMRWQALGPEYLEEFRSHSGLGLVCAHFDDHVPVPLPIESLRRARSHPPQDRS